MAFFITSSNALPQKNSWIKPEQLSSFEKVVKVKKGDTLAAILKENGVQTRQAHNAVTSLTEHYNPSKELRIGQEVSLSLRTDENQNELERLAIPVNFHREIIVHKEKNGGFNVKQMKRLIEDEYVRKNTTIVSSLFQDGNANGIHNSILLTLTKQFSFEIDFQRDLKLGDSYEVVYQQFYDPIKHEFRPGELLYAALEINGQKKEIFRYKDKNGNTAYYNSKGESVKKSLLKTPMDAFRISSRFGMRKHPILGYSKMHTGIDFAAPRGTPIYAAGDGRVSYLGRRGGYGKYIRLKHNGTYSTAYAHLSRYKKGLKKGHRVKQGQVIGYVGSTGRSTGPHLHYEVLINGKHVNPLKVTLKSTSKLKGKELSQFRKNRDQIVAIRDNLPKKYRFYALRSN